MSFNIIPLASFEKEIKRLTKKYPSIKQDYSDLLDEIELNPKLGTPLGRNCYKIRLSITSKGRRKSGAARVITHLIINVERETLYLLKIYDKAEQENISETELKNLLNTVNQ